MNTSALKERLSLIDEAEQITTLEDLFHAMKSNDPRLPAWDSLPTFGGHEPVCTEEVWSWDERRMITGSCSSDLDIVSRENGM